MNNQSIAPLCAVYDDDLDMLLKNLKISRDLEVGRLRCSICSTQITRDNLLALLPDANAVSFICSNPTCLKSYLRTSDQ